MVEPSPTPHATVVQNEQLKLAAMFFNNVAVTFVAAGVIVPAIATAYQTGAPQGRFWIVYVILWVVMAIGNHLIGRTILSRIKP